MVIQYRYTFFKGVKEGSKNVPRMFQEYYFTTFSEGTFLFQKKIINKIEIHFSLYNHFTIQIIIQFKV